MPIRNACLPHEFADILNRFQKLATRYSTANIAKNRPQRGVTPERFFAQLSYHCKLALQVDQCNTTFIVWSFNCIQIVKMTGFFCAWKYYRPKLTDFLWCDYGLFRRLLLYSNNCPALDFRFLLFFFDKKDESADKTVRCIDLILLNKLGVDWGLELKKIRHRPVSASIDCLAILGSQQLSYIPKHYQSVGNQISNATEKSWRFAKGTVIFSQKFDKWTVQWCKFVFWLRGTFVLSVKSPCKRAPKAISSRSCSCLIVW